MSIGPKERAEFKDMQSSVLSRFNEIEFQLTAILMRALGLPKEKEKFGYRVLFNNSIIPFSQKVKLLFNMRPEMGWPNVDAKCFHRLIHIRNQFAHCMPQEVVRVEVDGNKNCRVAELMMMLESLEGNRQLKPVNAKDAFKEFKKYDKEVSSYLRSTHLKADKL